jgi:hypothetical protein
MMINLIVVCSLMVLGIVNGDRAVHAGTFQWTDDNGTAGFTDNLLTVPQRHRNGVVKHRLRGQVHSSIGDTQTAVAHTDLQTDTSSPGIPPGATSSDPPVEVELIDEDQPVSERERWRERLQEAKAKIVERRAKRSELEKTVDESRYGMWLTFGPGASDLERRKEIPKIEQELQNLDQEIKQLEDEVRIVIPREARRAGVPLGWLR